MATKKKQTKKRINKRNRTYLIISVAAGVVVFITLVWLFVTRAATPLPPAPQGKTWHRVYSEDFNGSALNGKAWQVVTGTEGHSQSTYSRLNNKVGGGVLKIVTKRHCTRSNAEALTDGNASTAPCSGGKITKYSSGYVKSFAQWKSGYMEIRAKLPKAQTGIWPAMWLRNNTSWCNIAYGELDIMEWYADQARNNTATSHISCSANNTKRMHHNLDMGANGADAWHVWSIQWDASGIVYRLDGKIVSSAKAGDSNRSKDSRADFGVSQSTWNAVMNQGWHLRLNTQVIKAGVGAGPWHPAANNSRTFPAVEYIIDYVRVYQLK